MSAVDINPSLSSVLQPGGGKKKQIIIVVILIAILVIAVALYYLFGSQKSEPGTTSLLPLSEGTKEITKIKIEEQYQNPFDKETQYVNPFEEFKSPFHSLQQ